MDTCDAKLMKPFMSVTCSGPLCGRGLHSSTFQLD
jgi:hypothetical protein